MEAARKADEKAELKMFRKSACKTPIYLYGLKKGVLPPAFHEQIF
jgi:hypothetical protein